MVSHIQLLDDVDVFGLSCVGGIGIREYVQLDIQYPDIDIRKAVLWFFQSMFLPIQSTAGTVYRLGDP